MNQMDPMYRINDVLTSLADEMNVVFKDDDDKDHVLNALSHYVARWFKVGVYEVRPDIAYSVTRVGGIAIPPVKFSAPAGATDEQLEKAATDALVDNVYIGPIRHEPGMCNPGRCPGPNGCWCAACERGEHP